MVKVRHKSGHRATDAQINAMVDLARATRMDESWFGEIIEAKAKSGGIVHVVKDRERGTYLTLKYAVKLLDESVGHVRNYLGLEGAVEFERLMRKVGLITPKMEKKWFWTGRFVSRHKSVLVSMVKTIFEHDAMWARCRPMKVCQCKKSKLYYFDTGDNWDWMHSTARWFCGWCDVKLNISYEVWGYGGLTGNNKYYHHIWNGRTNGRTVGIGETCRELPDKPLSPEEIVSMS